MQSLINCEVTLLTKMDCKRHLELRVGKENTSMDRFELVDRTLGAIEVLFPHGPARRGEQAVETILSRDNQDEMSATIRMRLGVSRRMR